MQIMKTMVEFFSVESSVYHSLSSLSGSTLCAIRRCRSLALCSLFETKSNPVCGCLLQIWLDHTALPCWLSINPGP